MNGLRKAALYLHSIGEEDRRWLLDALLDEDRERLQATLFELDEMGVPKGDPLLPDIAEVYKCNGEEIESSDPVTEIEKIDQVSQALISQVLEREPDNVIARVLNQRVWSWRQDYISKQYLQKRKHLLEELETPHQSLKPKVESALLHTLVTRLNKVDLKSTERFETVLADAERSESAIHKRNGWRGLWRR
ncbi:MAG: hypothetical protein ABW170_04800 [Candidatus Thiodiazotropha sp. L084R]